MPQSNVKRSAIIEQLLSKSSPQHEPEVEEAVEAYQEARARSRQSVMLDFRLLDGTVESFSYAYLTRVRFTPGDIIDLQFGPDEVQIKGRNLARLCETITEQRARFVQEAADGEEGLRAADAAHVEQILIIEKEEL